MDDDEWPLSYGEQRVEPCLIDAREAVRMRASVLLDAARLERLANEMREEAKQMRRLYECAVHRAQHVEQIARRLAGVEDGQDVEDQREDF